MSSVYYRLFTSVERMEEQLAALKAEITAMQSMTVGQLFGDVPEATEKRPIAIYAPKIQDVLPEKKTNKGTKEKMLQVLRDNPQGIVLDDIKREFITRWGITITTEQVNSAMTYLKSQKTVVRTEEKLYKLMK